MYTTTRPSCRSSQWFVPAKESKWIEEWKGKYASWNYSAFKYFGNCQNKIMVIGFHGLIIYRYYGHDGTGCLRWQNGGFAFGKNVSGLGQWGSNSWHIHNVLTKQMAHMDGSFLCRPRRLHRHCPKLVNNAPRKCNRCLVVFDLLEYVWGSSSTRKEFDKIELMICR